MITLPDVEIKVSTITGVRDNLLAVFNALLNGEMDAKSATEINNTAGKIIASAKVQLAYHAMRGERPEIAFLCSPPTMTTIEQDITG